MLKIDELRGLLNRKTIRRKHTDSDEFDLETSSPAGIIRMIQTRCALLLIKKICAVDREKKMDPAKVMSMKAFILETAISLFREERFWESHVLLESLWKSADGELKKRVQNVIYFSVSMIKYQMGQIDTAKKVFLEALEQWNSDQYAKGNPRVDMEFEYPFPVVLLSEFTKI